jgi:hypothetical protein
MKVGSEFQTKPKGRNSWAFNSTARLPTYQTNNPRGT